MEIMNLLEQSSLEELKCGYLEEDERYVCIFCGEFAEKGRVYPEPEAGAYYEAWRHMQRHVEKAHGSAFESLVAQDKTVTGLSELQRRLLALFYQGKSDAEIQKELSVGSSSTIRNHRFMLREKERQARAFLALMELYAERASSAKPRSAAASASSSTQAEAAVSVKEPGGEGQADPALEKYWAHGTAGPLKSFPKKLKHKRMVLEALARRFEHGRMYSEQEVNGILEEAYEDYALLRRGLVDEGYLDREPDGSRYWRKTNDDERGEQAMTSRRDELKQLAKETKIEGGIFQIRNKINGKIWVESTRNFKTLNGQEFSLKMGGHKNAALQKDWKEFGEEAFETSILETLEKKENAVFFDEKDALKKLKLKWLKELGPYGERGYNNPQEEARR